MSATIARRVGAVAGLALIPAIAFGATANAATETATSTQPAVTQQADAPAQHEGTVKVDGTITAVAHGVVNGKKAEFITVSGGKGKSMRFAVTPKTTVSKDGHRVPSNALAKGQHVRVTGKKLPKGGAIAKSVTIDD